VDIRTEIWGATKCAENVADVIRSRDPHVEDSVPLLNDPLDNRKTSKIQVLERRQECTLLCVEEIEWRRFTRVL
jgi:hypothetical protein